MRVLRASESVLGVLIIVRTGQLFVAWDCTRARKAALLLAAVLMMVLNAPESVLVFLTTKRTGALFVI